MKIPGVISLGGAALLALNGCLGGSPSVGAARPGQADSILVLVDNQNFYDTSVFVRSSSFGRRRLGGVAGHSHREFAFRWNPSEVRFEVDFVGARFGARTEYVLLRRDDVVELQILSSSNQTGQLIIRRR